MNTVLALPAAPMDAENAEVLLEGAVAVAVKVAPGFVASVELNTKTPTPLALVVTASVPNAFV